MVDSVSRRLCRLIAAQKSRAYFGSQTCRCYDSPALDFYWSRALRPQPRCVSEPYPLHQHHPQLAWALPQLGTGCDRERRPTAVTATGCSVEIQHKGIVDICIPITISTQAEAMVPQFRLARWLRGQALAGASHPKIVNRSGWSFRLRPTLTLSLKLSHPAPLSTRRYDTISRIYN